MKARVTKKLLKNYRKIMEEVPILREELNEMLSSDSGIVSDTVLDYSKGYPQPRSITGFNSQLYSQRRRILERKEAQLKAVEEWIDSLDEGRTRAVFRMRYIKGMSWMRIADKLHYGGNEAYPRIRIRDEYFKHNPLPEK